MNSTIFLDEIIVIQDEFNHFFWLKSSSAGTPAKQHWCRPVGAFFFYAITNQGLRAAPLPLAIVVLPLQGKENAVPLWDDIVFMRNCRQGLRRRVAEPRYSCRGISV